MEPGEEKEVTFTLDGRDFSYYDARRKMWVAESGEFVVSAGSSSRDIREFAVIKLQSTQEVPLAFDEYTFFKEFWKNDQTRAYLIELTPTWIGLFTPEGKRLEEAEIPDFLAEHPMIKYPYITSGEISSEQVKELVEKCKDLTFTP